MNPIQESYNETREIMTLREAANELETLLIDIATEMRRGKWLSFNVLSGLNDFMSIRGSNNFRMDYVKKAEAEFKKIDPRVLKLFKDSFIEYAKKAKEGFHGYETLMVALGLENVPAVFKISDFDLKTWDTDLAADRIAVTLLYGGDRLKAFEKWGNIPKNKWGYFLQKHAEVLKNYGVDEWMATELKYPSPKPGEDYDVWLDGLIQAMRQKYRI